MAEGKFWDAGLEEDRDIDRVVANAEREPQAREKGKGRMWAFCS